jgi:tRNA-Thr(GGU) m(6)t(6)A37 methyltransferase TsaA
MQNLQPIAFFHSDSTYKYDISRQPVFENNKGEIHLEPHQNFEQALEELEGFERLWIIFSFHQNNGWKPKVLPPRSNTGKKIGLFATRSPYRPNNIGLSCVKLISINKRIITVSEHDLLDHTPILDIKPYVPYCDAFPNAKAGWVDEKQDEEFAVEFTAVALEKSDWIKQKTAFDLQHFASLQLSYAPTNNHRKRVIKLDSAIYSLAYRTWRILFTISDKTVFVNDIHTGYSPEELHELSNDKYADKDIHNLFQHIFSKF